MSHIAVHFSPRRPAAAAGVIQRWQRLQRLLVCLSTWAAAVRDGLTHWMEHSHARQWTHVANDLDCIANIATFTVH
jgi:hypothetical protein